MNIPGTVGGAVRMNANAYGGELARTLQWVDVAGAGGVQRRAAGELDLSYRHSNLAEGEIVIAGAPASRARGPGRRSGHASRSCVARRHEAQPQGIRTFGSTFKNPQDPRAQGRSAGLLLAEAGCNGLDDRGRPLLAQARELHREHGRGAAPRRCSP